MSRYKLKRGARYADPKTSGLLFSLLFLISKRRPPAHKVVSKHVRRTVRLKSHRSRRS
jgi:hypothetical protein